MHSVVNIDTWESEVHSVVNIDTWESEVHSVVNASFKATRLSSKQTDRA